jgi:hypothetical protein
MSRSRIAVAVAAALAVLAGATFVAAQVSTSDPVCTSTVVGGDPYGTDGLTVKVNCVTTTTTTTVAPTSTSTTIGTTSTSTTTTQAPTTTAAPTTTTTVAPTTTAPPPATGFPTPATTGYKRTGVTLTPYTGPSTITTAGTVIDSKSITTCLRIAAPKVTIKRSLIKCSGDYGIIQSDYSGKNAGLLVEDTEITSTSQTSNVDRAVATANGATIRRVYIHGTQRGISVDNNTVVEGSYIGDNYNITDAHTTGIVSWGGVSHVVIRNNTVKARYNATSAISFYPEQPWGGNDDFIIDHNLLATDGSYAAYLGGGTGDALNTNFRFTNNHFSTEYEPLGGIYGPVVSWHPEAPGAVWSGHVWHDGPKAGQPDPP